MNRTRLDPPRWDLAKASAFCHTACFEASREHPNSIFWTQLLPSDPAHECLVVDPALSILLSCSYRPLNVTPPRLLAKAGAPPAPTLTFSGALLTITYHECPWGGALDPGPVVRVLLKSAKGADARHQSTKELACPSGGAPNTATVVRESSKASSQRNLPIETK